MGPVSYLHRISTLSVSRRCRVDILSILYRHRIGIAWVSYQYRFGVVMMSFRHRIGIAMVSYLYRLPILTVARRYRIGIISISYGYRLPVMSVEYRNRSGFASVPHPQRIGIVSLSYGYRIPSTDNIWISHRHRIGIMSCRIGTVSTSHQYRFCHYRVAFISASSTGSQCPGVTNAKFDDATREKIIAKHNEYRSKIAHGTAKYKGGQTLSSGKNSWDCSLEQSAQNWSDRCEFDPSYPDDFGENYDEFNATNPTAGSQCPWVTNAKFDEAARAAIVAKHNEYRSKIAHGTAKYKGGQTLSSGKNSWDCGLEQSAQDWSDRCEFDPSYPDDFGENYDEFNATNPMKVAMEAMEDWWGQLKQYDASSNPNITFNDDVYEYAMHWSQMAWGEATKIGCGIHNCTHEKKQYSVITCHYDFGNWPLQPVFEQGNGCSVDADCTTYPNSKCDTSSKLCNGIWPLRPVFELGNGCSADADCTAYPDSTCDTSSKLCK
ncbi:Venom allergen 3 [Toxocara canis]|uniref:Venom allergen 3 n=1 Tax=Toxocara canis TaxID=6265 RepID=A0A0B2V5J3_TOXCA|nr:Venom allergen 3 [Toxocara canis]